MKISGAWPASTAPRAKLNGKPARVGSSVPEVPTYRMLAIRASVALRAAGRRGAGAPPAEASLGTWLCEPQHGPGLGPRRARRVYEHDSRQAYAKSPRRGR